MDHIQGIDRDQPALFPEALDDYIAQDNPVRFTDTFVDSHNLQALDFTTATSTASALAASWKSRPGATSTSFGFSAS
ncbi:MAG TPA: hypothetical protein VJK02_18180 [Anaerolineales bacterium]|nr:hypothetical protein [Anaerolineales bacterium]